MISKISSQQAAVTLTVHLKASWYLAALLAAVHGCALALLWMVPLPPWLSVIISIGIAASGALYIARDALRRMPQSITGAEIRDDGRCAIESKSGARRECELLGSSFVAPYLTVMNFRSAGSFLARSVAILPDSIEVEDFRRLRVLLRWNSGKSRIQDSGFST